MNEWMERVSDAVKSAAKRAELPRGDFPAAFDGDSWVWIWRDADMQKVETSAAVPEATVRVRLDPLGEGMEIVVSGGAWRPDRREISVARVYHADYLQLKKLPEPEALAIKLEEHLRRAWTGALEAAKTLPEIERRRNAAVEKLRSKGLLAIARAKAGAARD